MQAPYRTGSAARWGAFAGTAGILALCTALAAWVGQWVPITVLAILYIVAVLCVAHFFAYRYAVASAIASVVVLNVAFVHPRGGLMVASHEHGLVLVALLAVSLLASYLSARQRDEARKARLSEQRAVDIRELAGALAVTSDIARMVDAVQIHLQRRWQGATIFLGDPGGAVPRPDAVGSDAIHVRGPRQDPAFLAAGSLAPLRVASAGDALRHCARSRQTLGAGTPRWPELAIHCVPLIHGASTLGALGVVLPERFTDDDVLEARAVADMLAGAMQRERNAGAVNEARAQAESQALRNTLLTSISHDFRTPLATIIGASSSLVQQHEKLAPADAIRLASLVEQEARYMAEMTENTLHWARLEHGGPPPQLDWQSIEDVLGPVVARTRQQHPGREIALGIPPGLPLIRVDVVLLAQALHNLLDNAIRYSPGQVALSVSRDGDVIRLDVADRGPTLTAYERGHVFDSFYRGDSARGTRGAGLGLAIAQAVAHAHDGSLQVLPRIGGGNVFRLGLPIPCTPPASPGESE